MKEITIILIYFFLVKSSYTKAQVTDTLAYLQQIVANKSKYVGKPFSTLEKDLKINIKNFIPIGELPMNIHAETSTSFYFAKLIKPEDSFYPKLIITWKQYLNADKSDSLFTKNDGGGGHPK